MELVKSDLAKVVVDAKHHQGKSAGGKFGVGESFSSIGTLTQRKILANFINFEFYPLILQPKFLNNTTINTTHWGDIPDDLIHLLVHRIGSYTAFIRFGAVCRVWHSVASANKFCERVPWLLLSEKEDTDLREFYDLSTDEVYQLPLPEAKGKKILGSAYGWLITVDENGQFNLLNPLNRVQIALPPQSSFQLVPTCPNFLTPRRVRDLFSLRATLAKDPATGDFIAMVTHMGLDNTGLSFCRSSDNRWTRIEGAEGIDGMLDFAHGHFFVTNVAGEILNCTVTAIPKMEFFTGLDPFDPIGSYYVVECGGEILVVSRFRLIKDDIAGEIFEGWEHYTHLFRVYKVDLKDKQLTEIKSIGDYALFVGFNSTICLPVLPDTKAFKRNCIYFTDDYHGGIFVNKEDVGGLDMGVFSLDDGSFGSHYPCVSKSSFSIPIWFMPQLF